MDPYKLILRSEANVDIFVSIFVHDLCIEVTPDSIQDVWGEACEDAVLGNVNNVRVFFYDALAKNGNIFDNLDLDICISDPEFNLIGGCVGCVGTVTPVM